MCPNIRCDRWKNFGGRTKQILNRKQIRSNKNKLCLIEDKFDHKALFSVVLVSCPFPTADYTSYP